MLLKINSNIVFFWKDGHFVCDDFIHHEQRSIDSSIYPILNLFSTWKEENEIFTLLNHNETFTEEFLKVALFQLKESKILIENYSKEYEQEVNLKHWDTWGSSSKYFHYNTRLLNKDHYIDKDEQYERLSSKRKSDTPPNIYKNINDSEKIKLPLPSYKEKKGFLETLLGRQTVRSFNDKPISLNDLSTMLYLTYGAQSCKYEIGIDKIIFKTSPSGGCRHPIEVYPVILNVEGLEKGLYHYSVENHELEVIHKKDMTDKVVDMAAGQNFVKGASVLFFYTACIERSMWKYQSPRTYRVLMMDMGHLSQTCFLVANWLGLGTFFSGHLNDQYVEEELKIDSNKEIVMGVSGIGYRSNDSLEYGRDLRFLKELNYEI
ncbi:SagB/ThcOx family dehydrogenase [Ureibacillus sinduriensis]|uniref:NADH oxidase n=1 Tax=Ureibacillus sinduriensis BLB-1 = JCM 15800 TaxID=1384057 RepID=A0A0A3HP81_9BACL|nr:SagB/ThcOx family dehydrogenase [Ureibacillus sinduriensis]KGR74194.1 NADH oxidase [Ureibacillus sinduriensis BLB-1 = JCM 15800]